MDVWDVRARYWCERLGGTPHVPHEVHIHVHLRFYCHCLYDKRYAIFICVQRNVQKLQKNENNKHNSISLLKSMTHLCCLQVSFLYECFNYVPPGMIGGTLCFRVVRPSVRGGPERTGPRPPPWVPLLKNLLMVAVSFPPVYVQKHWTTPPWVCGEPKSKTQL